MKKQFWLITVLTLILIFAGCQAKTENSKPENAALKTETGHEKAQERQPVGDLDSLPIEEQIDFLEEENKELMSQRPDYEIERAKEDLEKVKRVIETLPQTLVKREELHERLTEIQNKAKEKGIEIETALKSYEEEFTNKIQPFIDEYLQSLHERAGMIQDYTPDEYIKYLKDINEELKSGKYPIITDKAQLDSKKLDLSNINDEMEAMKERLFKVIDVMKDNFLLEKQLDFMEEKLQIIHDEKDKN